MKHTKTAKKTIGGLREVDDSDFKYTLDAGRIEFIKAIYPHLDTIVNNINGIKWGSYSYTGPDILTKVFTHVHGDVLEDNSTAFVPPSEDEEVAKVVFLKTVPVYIRNTDPIDITYLGGIVYELLNKTYNETVGLLQYCDPTSDIDINVNKIPNQIIEIYNDSKIQITQNQSLPTEGHVITVDGGKTVKVDYTDLINMSDRVLPDHDFKFYSDSGFTFIRNFYDFERKITPYYQDLTRWVFAEFEKCFENENLTRLTNSDQFYDLQKDDLMEYHELSGLVDDVEQGYLTKKIGKCFLIGFLTRNGGINPEDDISPINKNARMYKIQLIAKTNGKNRKYDHMMEMIINFEYDSVGTSLNKSNEMNIHGYNSIAHVYHQSITKLMSDNATALKDRQSFIEKLSEEHIHKAINHIKRMLYLIEIINKNKNRFFKLDRWGIRFDPSSPVITFYNYIKLMIKNKKRLPIKAYQAPDGTISSFEFIDPKNVLLAYIMLFSYGSGINYMTTNITYYEKVFTSEIVNKNIPPEFTDFKSPKLETIKDIFLESAYTENKKYNELIGTIQTAFEGGKRNKNKRRVTHKIKRGQVKFKKTKR